MSFDVFLSRFAAGDLAESPKQPVLDVIRSYPFTGPDKFGFYVLSLSGDDTVEVSAKGLESSKPFYGCALHIRRMNAGLSDLIYSLAQAGHLAIIPAMDDNPVFLVAEQMESELPPDMLKTHHLHFVSSASELAQGLGPGLQAWSDYRDHAVGSTPQKGGPTKR